MMLHVKNIKTEVIKKLHRKITDFNRITSCKEVYFNKKIKTYVGTKLHHGYVFLITEGNTLVYPRGVHGSVLRDVYITIKNQEIHGILMNEKQKIKIKLKKN